MCPSKTIMDLAPLARGSWSSSEASRASSTSRMTPTATTVASGPYEPPEDTPAQTPTIATDGGSYHRQFLNPRFGGDGSVPSRWILLDFQSLAEPKLPLQRQRDLALAMVKGVPPYPATGNEDSSNFPSILGKRTLPSQKGEQSRPAKKRSNVKFDLPPPLPKKAVRKSAGAAVSPPKSKKPSGLLVSQKGEHPRPSKKRSTVKFDPLPIPSHLVTKGEKPSARKIQKELTKDTAETTTIGF